MATTTTVGGGTWTRSELGRGFGQDGGAALAVGGRVHVAYLNAFALQVADAAGGAFAEQTVSSHCDEGPLALGLDGAAALHVMYGCHNDDGVYWLRRRGDRFPDGWNATCQAIADQLYAAVAPCAPVQPCRDCCIAVETATGTDTDCSAGQTVNAIAYAVVCGDATVGPSFLEQCAPAAATVTCTTEGDEGTVVVPAPCVP